MDRDIPVFNRVVVGKINKKNIQSHLQRLKLIKAGSNRKLGHNHIILSNKKGILQEEEKKASIEKNNAILFKKLYKIKKRSVSLSNKKIGPYSDRIKKVIFQENQINEENKSLFERLEKQKPTLSNQKLFEDRMKNLTILKFLGKYPNKQAQKTFLQSSLRFQKNLSPQRVRILERQRRGFENTSNSFSFEKNLKRRNKTTSIGKESPNYRLTTMKDSSKTKTIDNIDVLPLKKTQILLFQKKMKIQQKLAEVRIFRQYRAYQIYVKFSQKVSARFKHIVTIPQKQGNQFFSFYDYDYEKIASMLIIEEGNLVVDIPNGKKEKVFEIGGWGIYEQALQDCID